MTTNTAPAALTITILSILTGAAFTLRNFGRTATGGALYVVLQDGLAVGELEQVVGEDGRVYGFEITLIGEDGVRVRRLPTWTRVRELCANPARWGH